MNELLLRRKPSKVTETGLLTPVNCVVAFAKTLSGDNNFGLGSVKQGDPRLHSFRISRELRVESDRHILAVLVQSRVFAGEGADSFRHIGIRKPLLQRRYEETLSDQTRRDSRFRSRSSQSTQDRLYRQYKKEK